MKRHQCSQIGVFKVVKMYTLLKMLKTFNKNPIKKLTLLNENIKKLKIQKEKQKNKKVKTILRKKKKEKKKKLKDTHFLISKLTTIYNNQNSVMLVSR